MSDMHERDIAATDEMIRNLKAGSFRKVATGVGAAAPCCWRVLPCWSGLPSRATIRRCSRRRSGTCRR